MSVAPPSFTPGTKSQDRMVHVGNLQCEYRNNPLGIDTTVPRFGWQLQDAAHSRGRRQTAYRIRVASHLTVLTDEQREADLWDSGHVSSDQSVGVPYAGKPLLSGDDCWWQVRVWDQEGNPTAWSEPARFSVGLLHIKDWQAQWIGMASAPENECPYFRRTFSLPVLPETAFAYVGYIGYHELYVNGRAVGDQVLSPSVSHLAKRALYVTYDIREYLQPGENVVALWAAPGWAQFLGVNPPVDFDVSKSPLCIARLQFGTPRDQQQMDPILTDATWRCALSTTSHLGRWTNSDFGGDRVDAGKEIPLWNVASLDESAWEHATVYASERQLSPDTVEPNRRSEKIPAARIEPLGEGRYRVEMARIFTGWLELTLQAKPCTEVTVKTSSRSHLDAEFNQINQYVVGPKGNGTFCERFSYHQYHYVILEGLETPPSTDQIVGYRIGNDLRHAGAFHSSNTLLNAIYEATIDTFVNLTTGGMTVDCPHRERLGYGGDGHTCLELALDHFDSNAFFVKWAQDWCDVQEGNGNIYHTAPTMDGGGGPGWSGFVITMPFAVYQSSGDLRILEQTYPSARRWLAFLGKHVGDDGLLGPLPGRNAIPGDAKWAFLGDWAAPRGSEGSSSAGALLFNNCYYVYVLDLAEQIANLLGKPDAALEYRVQAEKLRKAIDLRFYDATAQTYLDTCQVHCILPLIAGVAQGERITEIQKTFETELCDTRQGHLDTGLHGTYFMTKYLTEQERSDLVFLYATQTDFPSYGELLAKGYTTWPEYWGDADSKTHGCLNGIGGWFQRGLAGIRPDTQVPGYRHVLIRPAFVGDLKTVEAHHDGPYGRIHVQWKRETDDQVTLDVTIPPNSYADVYLPGIASGHVTESGVPAASAPGVTLLRTESGASTYRIESGLYHFLLFPNAGVGDAP